MATVPMPPEPPARVPDAHTFWASRSCAPPSLYHGRFTGFDLATSNRAFARRNLGSRVEGFTSTPGSEEYTNYEQLTMPP